METSAANVVRLRGELDVSNIEPVQRALAEAIDAGTGPVVVDLGDVTYIDSTAIGALVIASNRAKSAGRTLELRNTTDRQLQLLRITGLTSWFGLDS